MVFFFSFLFRSVPMSIRLTKEKEKKIPQLDTTPPTRLASCEPNEAASETSAAKPIGRLVDSRRVALALAA